MKMGWFMSELKKQLQSLLDAAELSGLSDQDIIIAKEFLEYNEAGLCFDHIITQLYEYDIEINRDTYLLIGDIGSKFKLPIESYSFVKELVKLK